MNERQVTMQAIRYLSQVCEKLSFHIANGDIAGRKSVDSLTKCADQIEHIAQFDTEDLDLSVRLDGIIASLEFLKLVRDGELILSTHGLSAPSIGDIDMLIAAAKVLRS